MNKKRKGSSIKTSNKANKRTTTTTTKTTNTTTTTTTTTMAPPKLASSSNLQLHEDDRSEELQVQKHQEGQVQVDFVPTEIEQSKVLLNSSATPDTRSNSTPESNSDAENQVTLVISTDGESKYTTVSTKTKVAKEFESLDKYWKASNYLAAGQIYLNSNNPLLKRPLTPDDIKPRLLGHWGTCPGQNFIWTHLNKLIKERELQMFYVSGPGHGGNFMIAQTYLEGSYTDMYPNISQDEAGIGKLFQQFSFPGGVPSHCSPEIPGSFHEGGELGYSLSHAFGAVLDKPDLCVACVVGDGEAETGPLATSWHANKFLNPLTDGVVLPILHLNGAKIANASLFARIPTEELLNLMRGYGYDPMLVEGSDPALMHPAMSYALNTWANKVAEIKSQAKEMSQEENKLLDRPLWPMIILKTPKGWTGPKEVGGKTIEGTFRSHQVPMSSPNDNKSQLKQLEQWLRSYDIDELFDSHGKLREEISENVVPPAQFQMGRNPYTNPIMKPLILPTRNDMEDLSVKFSTKRGGVVTRGTTMAADNKVLGDYLAKVFELNESHKNFRMFSPDETDSNRLMGVWKSTNRQFMGLPSDEDENTKQYGRVMEMLSEHQMEGMLEGYLLTGGHGLLNSYEAFVHVIDSMVNQHIKWMEKLQHIPWRHNLGSLNLLLSSHVWRQDHNGFTHQDPGFLNHVSLKRSNVVRVYLPPDSNTLLTVMHHCLDTYNRCNVIVSGKHPSPQWLTLDEAKLHCHVGGGIWEWASTEKVVGGGEPDVIIACGGDVPTMEALAAVSILKQSLPKLKIRFINIVDLFILSKDHPHGLSDTIFDSWFTTSTPIVFAFHGYPSLIHQLVYQRTNRQFIIKGYKEEGTITTPFDMVVRNELDRYHLVMDVCDVLLQRSNRSTMTNEVDVVDSSSLATDAVYLRQEMSKKLVQHSEYIQTHGIEMDEIRQWKWEN